MFFAVVFFSSNFWLAMFYYHEPKTEKDVFDYSFETLPETKQKQQQKNKRKK